MILPGSLIPSDKYFLKNLTFVVRISTRVATSPFQSNSLRGQGSLYVAREEVVMTSRPVGQEGHCFLVVCFALEVMLVANLYYLCLSCAQ